MSFQVYNTLAKEKQLFVPREPGLVRMYNCGPTVYSRIHIGNLRAFLFADTLRRWLEYRGYKVLQVMNITDVGHLQDDEHDTGDDKIESLARKQNKDPWEISRHFADLFLRDLAAMGCKPALSNPRASEYVPQMLAMIEGLEQRGYAYRAGDQGEYVYFDVGKFPAYGRLSGNRTAQLEAGSRIAVREEKRHPEDFALWKSDPQHLMKWKSRYGEHGFPGWHIECSAMSRELLGEELDIHTGGEDNIFPHHECEIAQSEAFSGKTFVRYWLHARFLLVDGGKMSKRLGNVWNTDDVLARGFELRALRYLFLGGHYRQPLNFTWEILKSASAALENLDDLVRRLRAAARAEGAAAEPEAGAAVLAQARAQFEAGMDDDLNTPQALAAFSPLRSAVLEERLGSRSAAAALEWLVRVHEALGVFQLEERLLDAQVESLIAQRQAARAQKNWAESDRLRRLLLEQGIALEDTARGQVWKRIS